MEGVTVYGNFYGQLSVTIVHRGSLDSAPTLRLNHQMNAISLTIATFPTEAISALQQSAEASRDL